MTWNHIVPTNDLEPHDIIGMLCACGPRIDWDRQLVIHNAFDGREIIERIERGQDPDDPD